MALRFAGYDALVIKGQSRRPRTWSSPRTTSACTTRRRSGVCPSRRPAASCARTRCGSAAASARSSGSAGRRGRRALRERERRHLPALRSAGAGRGDGREAPQGDRRRRRPLVPDRGREALRAAYDRVYELAVRSSAMQKYHELGTPQNVVPLNALGGLPTRNLQSATLRGRRGDLRRGVRRGQPAAQVRLLRLPGRLHPHRPAAPGVRARLRVPATTGVSYDYELICSRSDRCSASATATSVLDLIETVEELWPRRDVGGRRAGLADRGPERAMIPAEPAGRAAGVRRRAGLPGGDRTARRSIGRGLGDGPSWHGRAGGTLRRRLRPPARPATRSPATTPATARSLGHVVGARHSHLDAPATRSTSRSPGSTRGVRRPAAEGRAGALYADVAARLPLRAQDLRRPRRWFARRSARSGSSARTASLTTSAAPLCDSSTGSSRRWASRWTMSGCLAGSSRRHQPPACSTRQLCAMESPPTARGSRHC